MNNMDQPQKSSNQIGVILATIFVCLAVLAAGFVSRSAPQNQLQTFGSVAIGNEYHSTSTSFLSTPISLIATGNGALGSIIITGSNTGVTNIYDATTTNINLRTGQAATSSILIASLPASLAVGTYTFDVLYFNGLLFDRTGTVPTSTITYR